MIVRQIPWVEQPQESVGVADWLPPGSLIYTPPTGLVLTPVGAELGAAVTIARSAYLGGLPLEGSATDSRLPIGRLLHASADPGMTWVAQFVSTTTAARYVAGTVATGSSYIEDFGVNKNSTEATVDGFTLCQIRAQVGSTQSLAGSSSAVLVQGRLHTVVWQWRGAGNFRLWVDGVSRGVSVNLSTNVTTETRQMEFPLVLANRNVRGAFSNGGAGLKVGLYARIPGASLDGASLSANPWQLFQPRTQQIDYAAAAGGGLPTLSAATFVPGSLTTTGFRPRVTATY